MATKNVSSSQQQLPWCVKGHEEAIERIMITIIAYVSHVRLVTVTVAVTVLARSWETLCRLAVIALVADCDLTVLVALRALGAVVLGALVANAVLCAVSKVDAGPAVLAAHALQGLAWSTGGFWDFVGDAVVLFALHERLL